MAIYSIAITNNSSQPQDFILYGTPPTSAASGSDGLNYFFPCIGSASLGIEGSVIFQLDLTMYGVCGRGQLENNAQVIPSDTTPQPIVLGSSSQKGTTLAVTYNDGAISFDNPEPQESATPGDFLVHTTPGFTPADNVYVGYAILAGNSQEKLTNVVAYVDPARTYTIEPHLSYRISTGTCRPGYIVDMTAIGDPLVVEFERGHTSVFTTLQSDGIYSPPVYS